MPLRTKLSETSDRKSVMRIITTLSSIAFLVVALHSPLLKVSSFSRAPSASDDSSVVLTSTRAGRLAVFDDAWETIQERYYDATFRGVDWQAMRTTYRPQAAEAAGSEELYDVIRQMLAPLADVHTRVYSPTEKFDWWNPRFVTIGLTIREIDSAPTVVHVDSDSAAQHAGIKVGDVIVSVNNESASGLIARRLQHPVSTSARSRTVATLLEGAPGTSVKLVWQNRYGKSSSGVFQRFWNQRELGVHFQRKGKIVIVGLEVFTASVAVDFFRSFPRIIKDAEGIVLDLRANGGGDAQAMADIASAFLRDGTTFGRFEDRSGGFFDLQTNSKLIWPAASFARTKLPIVVLTSANTSSAAEIMAATLQTTQRARLIGTATCGCVLAIRNRHTLPDGGVLDVSELDYKTVDGVRLEGVGVSPDERVSVARSDLYKRRDAAMQSAITFLKHPKAR